ncbi:hypothetical protein LGN23_36470, partial [Burkholderia seminalis]|nr:hypothetical protein [Burkholderia seminalis]
ALGLAQDADDLLVGKSLLHRVLLVPRIKENSLAGWLQETSQVIHPSIGYRVIATAEVNAREKLSETHFPISDWSMLRNSGCSTH